MSSLADQCEQQAQGWWVVVVVEGETTISGQNDVHPLVSGAGGIPPLTTADHPWLVDYRSVGRWTQVLERRKGRGIPGLTNAGWSFGHPPFFGALLWGNPWTLTDQWLVDGQLEKKSFTLHLIIWCDKNNNRPKKLHLRSCGCYVQKWGQQMWIASICFNVFRVSGSPHFVRVCLWIALTCLMSLKYRLLLILFMFYFFSSGDIESCAVSWWSTESHLSSEPFLHSISFLCSACNNFTFGKGFFSTSAIFQQASSSTTVIAIRLR